MNLSSFATLLGIVVVMVLVTSALAMSFAVRAKRGALQPLIRARFKRLREGWYQANITITNRSPGILVGRSLRRVRPRSARLMAPIAAVSTSEGDFQVWSDPKTDKPVTAIPLSLVIAPREARDDGVARGTEALATAWVFVPGKTEPAELVLELTLHDGEEHLRRYRFVVTRDA
jgi:hypothetical protein